MSRAGTKGGGKTERPDDHTKEVRCPAAPRCAASSLALNFEPHTTPPTSTTPAGGAALAPEAARPRRQPAGVDAGTCRLQTRHWSGAP